MFIQPLEFAFFLATLRTWQVLLVALILRLIWFALCRATSR